MALTWDCDMAAPFCDRKQHNAKDIRAMEAIDRDPRGHLDGARTSSSPRLPTVAATTSWRRNTGVSTLKSC